MDRSALTRLWPFAVLAFWLGSDLAAWPDAPADALPAAKLPGESAPTARRLAEAQKRAAKQEWAEAVEEFQRILEESGDDLVPLDLQKPEHCLQARRLCHIRLAALPVAARRLYRARVDEQAKKWLEQGSARRDPVPLRRLVEQAFCSSHTDRALDLLGDLAFERGDLAGAEQWWRMLAVPASEANLPRRQGPDADLVLVYPDPKIDVAQVRAKLMLLRLFRGETAAALKELEAFTAAHGKEEGILAGRKGNYAALLKDLSGQVDALRPPSTEPAWATFAGDLSRSRVTPLAPRGRWLDEPWRVRLDGVNVPLPEGPPVEVLTASRANQACAVHPLVVGDLVLVSDARSVRAFELLTGQLVGRCDLVEDLRHAVPELVKEDVRFTLTAAGDRVYARLGAPGLGRPRELKPGEKAANPDSFLVCLGLPPKDGKLPDLWEVRARSHEKEIAFFEGAPVVHEGRVAIARTRYADDGRAATSIDCYHAEGGARLWRQEVCEARESWKAQTRYRHHLLTLAGPNLVYCSHSGAVVAVDALSGHKVWAARYERRGTPAAEGAAPRDLAPCVYDAGRLFVAPADTDRILCLDAATGRTLWESNSIPVVHLLGVARGRLIFTTGGWQRRGIRALDALTGSDRGGWLQPPVSELPSLGRGLLAGERVLWPTLTGLHVLSQEDGTEEELPPLAFQRIKGNLALGQGCLVVATERELIGYVAPARLLEKRRSDAAAHPRDAPARYRLAVALADVGALDQALEEFKEVVRLDRAGGLGCRALAERHSLLLAAAKRLAKTGAWEQAAVTLTRAAAEEFPLELRLEARARLAELWEQARQFEKAVAAWQAILADPQARSLALRTADDVPRRAGSHAAEHIDRLIAANPEVYARFEALAKELVPKALAEKPDEGMDASLRLLNEFPNAAVTVPTARKIADRIKPDDPSRSAAAANRWFLTRPTSHPERAIALAQLARHYEQQQSWEAAAATWKRLIREHGEQTVAVLDARRSVGSFALQQLEKPEYRPTSTVLPVLGLPLLRDWESAAKEGNETPLPLASGSAPADLLVSIRAGDTLLFRDAATGKTTAHHLRQEGPHTWIGRQADLVLVAGPRGVLAVQQLPGDAPGVLWEFTPAATDGELSSFQLVSSRLFCLQGERRLWALDAETGAVLWTRWEPAARVRLPHPVGRFNPLYWAGTDRLVIQTSAGHLWLLDSATGRVITDTRLSAALWPQPPLPLDGSRLAIVADPRHIIAFDWIAGKETWRYPIPRPVSLTGEGPQLLGRGDRLLLLVARNHGYELDRLDPATGVSRWRRPVWIAHSRLDLTGSALDEKAAYLLGSDRIRTVSVADGSPLWERPLSDRPGHWRLMLTRNYLLAHPLAAEPDDEPGRAVARFLRPNMAGVFPTQALVPLSTALPGLLTALHLARAPGRFSLLAIDPADGQLIQRLNFETRGPAAVFSLRAGGAVVQLATGAWGLR